MRTLSFVLLVVLLTTANALAQTAQLAPIPAPLPFQPGTSVFQWDYQCTAENKQCGLSGLGVDPSYALKSASIVLARLKLGEALEIPTYYFWGALRDGSSISGMTQNEFSVKFVAINMKLVAAGPPGL
jgi:hypothetical protein